MESESLTLSSRYSSRVKGPNLDPDGDEPLDLQ